MQWIKYILNGRIMSTNKKEKDYTKKYNKNEQH